MVFFNLPRLSRIYTQELSPAPIHLATTSFPVARFFFGPTRFFQERGLIAMIDNVINKVSAVMKLAILCGILLLFTSCSIVGSAESANHKFTLVGSTPCDAAVRSELGIQQDLKCDFVRWNLTLDGTSGNSFTLEVNYGIAQANSADFVNGGVKLSASGYFEISKLANKRELYRLTGHRPTTIDISLIRLNSNIFHLVSPDGAMMIGTSGWSYTLNRDSAIADAPLPTSLITKADNAPRTVFGGRTPCRELYLAIDWVPDSRCLRLNWKLTLNREQTGQPTTFKIESTLAREKPIVGKWSIARTAGGVVYRLDPDGGMKTVSLLVADDNNLLFVDAQGRPLTGNADFSYTLSRES